MSFFSSLMGGDAAKSAQSLGNRNAAGINQGYGDANNYASTGYNAAQGRYAPYAAQGQRGYQAYGDALGINGDAARAKQFASFEADPFRDFANRNTGNQLNAIFKKYGASGMANSGASGLAVARTAAENSRGDVQNYLTHLRGMSDQGVGIANAQAGLDTGYYNGMADRAVGRANALASNDTNATMAMNNAKSQGMNNLLSGVGTIASLAMAPMSGGTSLIGMGMNALRGGGGGGLSPGMSRAISANGWGNRV